MSNERVFNGQKRNFDLQERTERFGESIISFAKKIPENTLTRSLISQIVRSGTSVGANYCEADDAESKKDFIHKLGIAKKEARETKYWLRMIEIAVPTTKEEAQRIWQEAKELTLIFNAIIRVTKENSVGR